MAVTLGSKNVGDIVKIRENGALVDFLVVHKGIPSNVYDASCDGVWVMRKVLYGEWTDVQHIHSGNYATGTVRSWMENTYYNMLDASVRAGVRYVKMPYNYVSGGSENYATGASGVPAHCFLLAQKELNTQNDDRGGATLSYFAPAHPAQGSTLRVAKDSGGKSRYWLLRDSFWAADMLWYRCATTGGGTGGYTTGAPDGLYIRPAMILDYNMIVNNDGSVTANTAPTTPGSISVPASIQGGSTVTISWGASSDAQGNLEGYKVERSINSGGWSQIYQGGGTSTTNNVAYGTNTVMYRVKAYDSMGLESGYKTSANVTVINNTAPGTPQGITVPADVRGGSPLQVSWGPSADAENNLAGYELERSVDGGTWTQVYKNAQQSFMDNITFGWRSVAYRVRAYDVYNAYSGYATSEARAVDNNRPPQIACDSPSGSDLGVKGEGFSIAYTVTDPDNNTGDVTVTETLDGAKQREFQPELGAVNNFGVEGLVFQCLPNGQHDITVTASDGKLGSTHTLRFTKSVTSAMITLETPLEADDQITVCAIATSGHIPEDAQFRVLVTNNANDAEPKWENCTQLVKDGANYVFSNQTAENGYAFNFKITVSRGESGEGGYITSVQGGFQ